MRRGLDRAGGAGRRRLDDRLRRQPEGSRAAVDDAVGALLAGLDIAGRAGDRARRRAIADEILAMTGRLGGGHADAIAAANEALR